MIPQADLKAEVSRLMQSISNVFTMEGDLEEAELAELHHRFVECIEATNNRLKKCDELLRKGLRIEAIQESEADPDLLDLVTELDIPEWDAWAEYVRQYGFPRQPNVLIPVAAEINEAYTQAQSLDSLLRLHRLHALARSPLRDRIRVLRNIAAKDPANSVWREDLQAYEEARFRQLGSEIQEQRDDLKNLSALWSEVTQSPWITPLPQKLVKKVDAIHHSLLVAKARNRLVELEQTISAAFSAFDTKKAEIARSEWEDHANIAELSEQDELSLQVKAAFEWLDQECEQQASQVAYDRALKSLEHLLDEERVSRTRLERKFSTVQRFEEAIPERLQRRYHERLSSLDLTEKRRSKLVLATSIALVLTVGAVAMLLMNSRELSAQILSAKGSLQELMKAEQFEQAEDFYEQLATEKPQVARSPEVQQLYFDLQARLKQEQARKRRLAQLLQQARETTVDKPTWESIAQAKKLLQEAESVAHGETDLLSLRELERDLDKQEGILQQEANALFQADVTALSNKIAKLKELTQEEVRALKIEAESLKERPYVARSIRTGSRMDLITRKIADREKHLSRLSFEEQLFFAVRQSIGMQKLFESALESYVQGVKYGSRPQDFQTVLKNDIPLLKRVGSWNKLARKWNRLSLLDSPITVGQALPIVDELKSAYADFPAAESVLKLRPYLESIGKRVTSSGDTFTGQLIEMFRKDVFNMKYLEEKQGDRYYFFGSSNTKGEQSDEVKVDVLVDARDLTRTERKSFLRGELEKLDENTRVALAPHSEFARIANSILLKQNTTFESQMCTVLTALLNNKRMEPLLKCGLLQYIIELASDGSTILAAELADLDAMVSTSVDINDVNWLDNGSETTVLRERTRAQLERISEDPQVIYTTKVLPQVDALNNDKPTLAELTWVACLMKDSEGQWVSEMSRGAKGLKTGSLVIGNYDNSTSSMQAIGKLKSGQLILDSSKASLFLEGRPIFLLTK